MHNYVFHYNEYQNIWTAVPREHIADYFNGNDRTFIKSADLMELVQEIELIYLSQQPDPEAETFSS